MEPKGRFFGGLCRLVDELPDSAGHSFELSSRTYALFDSNAFLQTLRILGAEGAVEVTYGKRDAEGRSLETLIEDSDGKHRMRMRLRDIRRAETFPDKVFKIRLPQGVEKIAL